ncbi:hypothetical protein V6N13_149610 [Hibiscus sabdariffa]
MAMAPCHGYYSDSKPYVPAPQKVIRLHFFLHGTLSGKVPSVVTVARPNVTTTSMPFDEVIVVDDPLTVSPDITGVIGNAQGLWVSTGRDVLTLMVYLDFGFTKGEFNGSSISMFSRNPITETKRELAVVGGRGCWENRAHCKTEPLALTRQNNKS